MFDLLVYSFLTLIALVIVYHWGYSNGLTKGFESGHNEGFSSRLQKLRSQLYKEGWRQRPEDIIR